MSVLRSFAVVTVFWLFGTPFAHAEASCSGFDLSKWTADSVRDARSCLADFSLKGCDAGLCKKFEAWKVTEGVPEARAAGARQLLSLVRQDVNAMVSEFPSASVLDGDIKQLDHSLEQGVSPDRISNRQWVYNPQHATLSETGEPGDQKVDLGGLLSRECKAVVAPERCNVALRVSARLRMAALLVQAVITELQAPSRSQGAATIDELDERWAVYFDKGRFQYPWELAVNSHRYHRDPGFSGPPNDQWILLHPSVGYRYLNGSGKKLEQTLLLEVAGYYRWEWAGAEATKLRGGSLVVSWADTATEFRRGIGFLVHMPKNYSLGLVQERGASGHKIALVMSLDLGKVVQDPKSQKASFLEAIR